eukprot:1145894-Pelagomonas_calceolata.AAC.3
MTPRRCSDPAARTYVGVVFMACAFGISCHWIQPEVHIDHVFPCILLQCFVERAMLSCASKSGAATTPHLANKTIVKPHFTHRAD